MATPDAPSRRMRSTRRAPADPRVPDHHDDPGSGDQPEDRWAWRRKIRADPRKARIYRVLVAVVGLLLILLGAVSGPLPGPGGIPLVLLGLAVLASEFRWAHRVMGWFKLQLHKLRGWSRARQVLAWLILFAGLAVLGYADLAVLGVPSWLPSTVSDSLYRLPGID